MNLPKSVDDPSLLEYEPLRSRVAAYECVQGQRSADKQTVSEFVKEMKQDVQAAAAAKWWARLVFLSDENSFTFTDEGEELYRVFFKYQYLLYKGHKQGNTNEARKNEVHIARHGPTIIKAVSTKPGGTRNSRRSGKGGSSNDQGNCSLRPSGPKKASRRAETRVDHPDAGDTTTRSKLERGTRSSKASSTAQQRSPFDPPAATAARRSAASEVATLGKSSTSKKGKRKASSQKPPFITPSDASEDDKESPNAHAVTTANSISHRPKRIASNPRQPPALLAVNNQVDKGNSAHRTGTTRQNTKEAVSISQPLSSLTSFQSDVFVSHSDVQGRRGAVLPPSDRKRHSEKLLNGSTHPIQVNSDTRRVKKKKLVRDPQPPASKRRRRASMSAREDGQGEEPEFAHNLQGLLSQEPTTRRPQVASVPTIRRDVKQKVRGKRTRLEFETPSVALGDTASANSHESLGPDNRVLRALPRKVRSVCSIPAVRGAPCGAPSLQHADQLLRDVASNALAVLREPVGPDVPDWTQDKEYDEECDMFSGDNQDEGSDAQVPPAAPVPPKPPVPAPPRLWAQSRQEVCESFEYFRCYHGGVYFKNDIVKGYLLGAYAANRDVFRHGGKLIISHGGGKSESILDVRGVRRYQLDQDQQASDTSVRALLKTCKERRPIVLLADDRYALFPYDLASANYTYVVLGLYWISHAWAECQPARDGSGHIVRWKFAFQWCEGQGEPWWLPQQEASDRASDVPKSISSSEMYSPKTGSPDGNPSIQCKHCRELSPFVYKQGWMCLNPRCNLFWIIDGEEPKQLDYREEFLQLLPQKFERLPNVTPTRVIETSGGITTTYAHTKGWHCTECGRMSCRYKWEHWECSNCKLQHVVNGRIRVPNEFWHQRPSKGFLHSQVGKESGIIACRLEPIDLGSNRGFTNRLTFILPHGRGKIHLVLGTPLSNREADEIFRLYQRQGATGELKLRRYPLRNHRARGSLLTNYFSQNSGEPYQYVGGSGQTIPFHDAPECVRRALALIKERASLSLRTDIPFNEILSAAYMERQKMAFHSDSEKGLGPTVASLSLGSAALMHFRLHARADSPKGRGNSHALTLVLRHGDVMIMDGDGIQKHYEHTVVPMNFRVAATARCIGTT